MAFKDHLRTIGKGLAGLAEEGYEATKKKAQEAREEVERRGGYRETFGQLAEVVAAEAHKAGTKLADVFDSAYESGSKKVESLRDSLVTDGKFDREKAIKVASNTLEVTRVYGKKAGESLAELAGKGKDIAEKAWNDLVPRDEEFAEGGRYRGIGSLYNGALFRPHYEACLTFGKDAEAKIPKGLNVKGAILSDIKAYAAGNAAELMDVYVAQEKKPVAKIAALQRYFK